MKKHTAFSLMELSIVILIIGILVAGITQGSRLVYQMKLTTAKTVTQSSPVASIKGLALWLETSSDDSLSDTVEIDDTDLPNGTTWKDINPQNPSKLTATVAGASAAKDFTYVANGINGLPTIRSHLTAGTATRRFSLSAVPAVSGNASTTFLVYRDFSGLTGAKAVMWNGASTAEGWGYIKIDSTGYRRVASKTDTTSSVAMSTAPEIASIVVTGSTSTSTAQLYINGTSNAGPTTLATAPGGFVSPTEFYIGNYNSSGFASPWQGYISEIIMFDGALKDSDRKAVEAYLGKKYGISVAS